MAVWSLVLSLLLICCGACYYLAEDQNLSYEYPILTQGSVCLACCVILYGLIFQAIALDWYSKKYRKSDEIGNSRDVILRLEMSKCIDEMSAHSSQEQTALKNALTTHYMNITIMISFWLGIIGTTICCAFWCRLYGVTDLDY